MRHYKNNDYNNPIVITDSAAAGTAIACGKKTNYLRVAADENMVAIPSILELCKLEGKSTGIVTTKSWIDATPTAFLSHSNERANYPIFQREISLQMLSSGVDLLLAYGTSTGVKTKVNNQPYYLHDYDASDFGYTVVDNLAEMNSAVVNGVTKLWSNFTEGNNDVNSEYDVSANHISYDISGLSGQLSLLDMTKAALKVLSNNINDEDGFFLMVEGGAIDNAAEGCKATQAVGEYLAFDEAFAYCVNWAMGRDDTIIIALPDHDSGGFTIGENVSNTEATADYDLDKNGSLSKSECLSYVVDTIINGTIINGSCSYVYAGKSGHTAQEVPVWMYTPDWCRNAILNALGIPTDTSPEKVRTGNFYDGTHLNSEYEILNSDISTAVIKACGLMGFAEAQSQLLVDADSFIDLDSMDIENRTITLTNGEVIYYNTNKWASSVGGTINTFDTGFSSFVFADTVSLDKGTLYLPRDFLIARGYIQN